MSPAQQGGFSLRILANFLILLGARTQEGQADDSKNGPASSGLHPKLDPPYKMPWEILREKKLRNGHGTNLERSRKSLELPGTASEGSQKGPGTKLAPPPLLSPPSPHPLHPPTHIPNGAWGRGPTSSLSWMVSPHQRGEGGEGGLDLGPQITRCMLSDRHDEASH